MIRVDVGNAPDEIKAAVLAMKLADKDVRRGVAQRMRTTMGPVWSQELTSHLTGVPNEAVVLTKGSRISGGNPGQMITASSKRVIGHGLVPDSMWGGFEYGANRNEPTRITNRWGTSFRRRTKRHLPQANKRGRVITPAATNVLPRIAAFWAQSVVKGFMDAADEGGG